MSYSLIYILFGIILLTAGRQLFWVFVGMAGLIAGFDYAQYAFVGQPEMIIWTAAIVCALVGVVLAIMFQEVMVILAGCLAGGTFALRCLSFFVSYDPASSSNMIIFLMGAIAGGLFMFLAFDIALIIISSLFGALLIVTDLPLTVPMKSLVGIGLVIFGIVLQSALSKSDSSKRGSKA